MQINNFNSLSFHSTFILSFCFLILFTSCNGCKNETTTYYFIVEESFLKDSLEVYESIVSFNCPECPSPMDKSLAKMIVPDKNSQIVITDTSTGKSIPIYSYNFIENLAGSSPNPRRYFLHYNKLKKEGFSTRQYQQVNLDSLFKSLDSTSIILSNSALIKYHIHNPTLPGNNIRDSLVLLSGSSKNNKPQKPKMVVIYLGQNPIIQPPVIFNPKLEIYQTLRQFYERLAEVYHDGIADDEKQIFISSILNSFSENGVIEIQNKDEINPTPYKIQDFLQRIISNERFQYEEVNIFMTEFSFLTDPHPDNEADIPGELVGNADYIQHFQASRKGKIVYQDEVPKSARLVMESRQMIVNGKKITAPVFVIETITVNGQVE